MFIMQMKEVILKLLKELNCNDVLIGIFEVEDFYEVKYKHGITEWCSFNGWWKDNSHCKAEYNTLRECKRFIEEGSGHIEVWDRLLKREEEE